MDSTTLRRWVRDVRDGRRSSRALVEELRRLPFAPLGIARLDTHRRLRRGIPEVILGEGKTPAHLIRILRALLDPSTRPSTRSGLAQDSAPPQQVGVGLHRGELVLVTRLSPQVFEEIHAAVPSLRYHPLARMAYQPARARRAGGPSRARHTLRGLVGVITGGTADVPVAEEAVLTLQLLGSRVARVYDVGVAGVHRLLSCWPLLQRARVIVAVAGMEGALPSVVAGLTRVPVIAIPTSVGYGVSAGGISAAMTMLASCVPGIGVVNIDNGFGGAYLAHVINSPPR
jgi:NCAIR mutase (PurE)-related protein